MCAHNARAFAPSSIGVAAAHPVAPHSRVAAAHRAAAAVSRRVAQNKIPFAVVFVLVYRVFVPEQEGLHESSGASPTLSCICVVVCLACVSWIFTLFDYVHRIVVRLARRDVQRVGQLQQLVWLF